MNRQVIKIIRACKLLFKSISTKFYKDQHPYNFSIMNLADFWYDWTNRPYRVELKNRKNLLLIEIFSSFI